MQAKGIPVTYMLFPDEGHGFARPENNTAFNAVTEGFLATCLGGRAEPIGDDFAGSSATVPVGADAVPGLEIGRASCRERVCPYGSISVVAVQLTKKTAVSTIPHSLAYTIILQYNYL